MATKRTKITKPAPTAILHVPIAQVHDRVDGLHDRIDADVENLKTVYQLSPDPGPIECIETDDGYRVVNGQQRLEMYKEMDAETVPIRIIQATTEHEIILHELAAHIGQRGLTKAMNIRAMKKLLWAKNQATGGSVTLGNSWEDIDLKTLPYGTVKELAKAFGVDPKTIHDWINTALGKKKKTPTKEEKAQKAFNAVDKNIGSLEVEQLVPIARCNYPKLRQALDIVAPEMEPEEKAEPAKSTPKLVTAGTAAPPPA